MKNKIKSLEQKEANPNGRVPRLRFTEFRASEGWNKKGLGELFSERQEIGYSDLPLLSLTDKDGIILQSDSNRKNTSNSDKSKYLRVVPGDIAYNTMRMWEGRSAIVDREGLVSPAYTVCKPEEIVNSIFFSYYFKTAQLIKLFHQYSQGLVKDTLNLKYENFIRISVYTPLIPEQQKIADCLSSLDELIAAQIQKRDALKAHKKGLMQQLFPTEGETVPKLRFPEFKDAPEWEEKQLGHCLLTHPEYGVNAPAVPYSESLPTYLRITDISEDGVFNTDQKVSVGINITSENYLIDGDIVLARTGASVGKSYRYKIADRQLVFAGFLIRIRPDDSKASSVFIYYTLTTDFYWKWIHVTSARSGQPGINGNEYASFPVLLPKMDEQQKVADCLSSLEGLIAAQSKKIDVLKAHKKGLMQQLFPSIDEGN